MDPTPDEIREALRPLAEPFAYGDPDEWPEHEKNEIDCCVSITYEDVKRARDVLARLAPGAAPGI